MGDIRTSGFGSSGANNFIINIIDDITSTTLNKNYPIGNYSIGSTLLDTSIDVYAYNSGGALVGSSTALTFTATDEFNKLVIVGGSAGDVISFSYSQSGFVSTALSDQTTAPATISSISPTFINTVNQSMEISGSNFASNVAVYFKGSDGVERAADSITRNSVTSLTITSPDTLPTQYSPYSIIVENPGVARPTLSNKHILFNGVNAAGTIVPWTRPADWLTLTAPASNEQKFIGLLAITDDDSNYVALLAQGNYTVDWGDGSAAENYTSNTKASHKYTYSSISSSTLTSRGYKQVLVTVTPQSGQNLTNIDLQQTYTRTNLQTGAKIPWLDIAIAGTNLSTIKLTGSTSPTFRMGFLERVNIVSSNLTSYNALFAWCTALQSVSFSSNSTITNTTAMFYGDRVIQEIPFFNTSSVTTMDSMFYGCYALESIPLLDTSSVTTMANMFRICSNLRYVPNFITSSSLTSTANMFDGCNSLLTVPLFNTSSVSNMSFMFYGCYSLKSVPLFNTAAVTTMSNMFYGCSSLESVPLFNTASVTNMDSMLYGCNYLQSVPLFNTASVTNMSSMFYGCNSLKSVSLFNTASVTNMSSMFGNCSSLEYVPLFNTAAVTNMSIMFYGCNSLKSVPLFNTSSVTNMGSMFSGCYSLKSVPLFNTVAVTSMSAMFADCSSLQYVPLFNTAAVTNMGSMFSGCPCLKEIPAFNISSLTSASGMARNTLSLEKFTLLSSASTISNGIDFYTPTSNFSNTSSSGLISATSQRSLKKVDINCTAITSAPTYSFATYYNSLSSVILTGMKYSFSVVNCRLDGTALNAMYTSLGTAAASQSVTVTANHGTVDDNPAIATAKGWTVTGS